MLKRVLVMLAILALPALGQTQSIIRDRSRHSRPIDLSVLGTVPYPAGFGVGLRVGLPIVPNGFIGPINDAVFLEPGVQFVYWSDHWDDFDHTSAGVQVPVFMRWDFFLSRLWTVYGEVGVIFGFFGDGDDRFKVKGDDLFRPGGEPGFLRVAFGGGAMINFSSAVSLRLDATTQMFSVGVTFRF